MAEQAETDDTLTIELTPQESETCDFVSVSFALDDGKVSICLERDSQSPIIGPGPFIMGDDFWFDIPTRVWDEGVAWITRRRPAV